MAKEQEVARSRALAAKVLYAAFQALKENNRELPYKEIQLEVQRRVSFDEWALATYLKVTGQSGINAVASPSTLMSEQL